MLFFLDLDFWHMAYYSSCIEYPHPIPILDHTHCGAQQHRCVLVHSPFHDATTTTYSFNVMMEDQQPHHPCKRLMIRKNMAMFIRSMNDKTVMIYKGLTRDACIK